MVQGTKLESSGRNINNCLINHQEKIYVPVSMSTKLLSRLQICKNSEEGMWIMAWY
jgi:hypothetical protein